MDVNAAGSAPPGLDYRPLIPRLPDITSIGQPGKTQDSIAPLLRQLASESVRSLVDSIEIRSDSNFLYLREAVAAVARRDFPHAIRELAAHIAAHPESAADLIHEPAFAEIRNELRLLTERLTSEAKIHAETALTAAERAVASPATPAYAGVNPRDILALATAFSAAGQYVNYVRAAKLCEFIIRPVAAPQNKSRRFAEYALKKTGTLWRRAPLLILLLIWIFVGIAGGLLARGDASFAFEIWGIGFLALVGVQFYVTVRNARF